jgi:N-formylglutamate amidohydrolase
MAPPFASFQVDHSPLIAVAVHHGHALRAEVAEWIALDERTRLREEDPFTGRWTDVADSRVVVNYSRFEVDLNRPREKAVYQTPEDAWGLCVWKGTLPEALVQRSLALYDDFYRGLRKLMDAAVARHGRVVVLDLHSYNHCRESPQGASADPGANPQINVGTGTMDRARWASIVERFLDDLRRCECCGERLDVRENVRFRGGHVPQWVHQNYPRSACALAVEVKKFFMNEWTGGLDERRFLAVRRALRGARPGIEAELGVTQP